VLKSLTTAAYRSPVEIRAKISFSIEEHSVGGGGNKRQIYSVADGDRCCRSSLNKGSGDLITADIAIVTIGEVLLKR
jgi:hypothetical protein